jgi:hypothetical protein
MDIYSILFCVAIIILLCYFFVYKLYINQVYVKSSIDGSYYLVRNLEDKEEAADLLANIRKQLLNLCNRLEKSYPDNKKVQLLIDRFRPEEISESPANTKYTSYSINKGERIVFCIRSRDELGKLVEINTVLFVALHELSHVMTLSLGHTTEFWENFRFLLAHAIHWNIYKPTDFKENPQEYCGTHITDSPLSLKDIPNYINYKEITAEDEDGTNSDATIFKN